MGYGWGPKIPGNDELREWIREQVADVDDGGMFVVTKAVAIYEMEDIDGRCTGIMWENCMEHDLIGLMSLAMNDLREPSAND